MELCNNSESKKQRNIPVWMLEKNKQDIGRQKFTKTSFLTKTIKELSSVIQNEVFSERFVKSKGYLQMIDPRVKLLTLLFFMLFCAITKSLITLVLLAFIALIFIKLSALNLKNYFKRVWMILPLWVFLLSIPAATNLFVNGTPFFYIYKHLELHIGTINLPNELFFSFSGLQIILKMALRIGISISFAYLLIMTTRWSCITKVFSVFRIPHLVITILNMTYRYIFIISKIATEMMEARFLRTIGATENKSNRSFIANRMSFLFIKTSYLSDEIYAAMRCRGFNGETVSLYKFRMQKIDFLWILNNIVILIVLFMGELIH